MKLRFALITTFYPPYSFGGDAIYVQNQAKALVARGHSVDILHSVDAYLALGGNQPISPVTENDGIRVFRLQSRLPTLSCLATHQIGIPIEHRKKIKSMLHNNCYDVIHYHNISLVGGPAILSYGNGIKLYTAHEHWLVCPTHILWKNNKEICKSKACIKCGITYRRPPQLWRYTRLLDRCAKHIDAFLALSEHSANTHQNFGFSQKLVTFPSTAANLQKSAAKMDNNHLQSRLYFLYVGRLEHIKGVQDIIPVFEHLPEADLIIAGEGSLATELKRAAKHLPNIKFIGKASSGKLSELYRNAVSVIVPSRCIEVFPLVILESFREGTPVLVRDTGPLPDIIQQSSGGSIYSDADELLTSLKEMLINTALQHSTGEKGLPSLQKILE